MMASSQKQQLSIPVVDFSSFLSGSLEKRQEISDELTRCCRELGFVSIVGHGISPELLQKSFAWSKKLFELDHEDKMKAPHPPGYKPHRGYSPPGLEKVISKQELADENARNGDGKSLRQISDFKESYEIGSEENPEQPNIWLPEQLLPGFRAFMTEFYWTLNKTVQVLLQAFAQGLGLSEEDKEYLFRIHSGHNNQLRLLHYPPILAEELVKQVAVRMPAHEDWSSFTILFQDDCGGLELQNPQTPGEFIKATPIPNSLILNVGDQLQRLSNDTFQSATHRVSLPPLQTCQEGPNRISRARYSIPYFVGPDESALIKCLPSLVDEQHPIRFAPIKFGDYAGDRSKYWYEESPVKVNGK